MYEHTPEPFNQSSAPAAAHLSFMPSRSDVLNQLKDNPKLYDQFQQWKPEDQEEFLDICTGVKGLKVVYDGVFKEIFNPETTPERLEELLSLLLRRKVRIKAVLPNDGARLGSETALLYTDIIVELEDGTLCDVEIQRIGFAFPGARGACYSSDHLLRQYKRIRGEKGKHFTYRDIKKVYTIVFFEKSTREFQDCPEHYLHWFRQQSDTGVELDLLQEYFFICLDIFKKNMENRSITTDLEAWLAFLSFEDSARILELTAYNPRFKAMYQNIYDISLNMERMMQVFSKELAILDRNTVRYMMDEMQTEIDQLKEVRDQLEHEAQQLKEESQQLKEKSQMLKEESQQLKEESQMLKEDYSRKSAILQQTEATLQQQEIALQQQEIALQQKDEVIQQLRKELEVLRR